MRYDDAHDDGGDEPTGGASAPEPATASAPQRFRVRPVVRSRRSGDAEGGTDADDRVVSRDETDIGWGDAPGRRDDEWYQRERPPHHGE